MGRARHHKFPGANKFCNGTVKVKRNINCGQMGRIAALIAFVIGCWMVSPAQAAVREYWIAAEKTVWNYAPSGRNLIKPDVGLGVWGETPAYTKYRYIGYTDGSYTKQQAQPEWMGILGPQLRAVVGDDPASTARRKDPGPRGAAALCAGLLRRERRLRRLEQRRHRRTLRRPGQ